MKLFGQNRNLVAAVLVVGVGFSSSVMAMSFCKNNGYKRGPDPYLMSRMYAPYSHFAPVGYGYAAQPHHAPYAHPQAGSSAPATNNSINQPARQGQGGAY